MKKQIKKTIDKSARITKKLLKNNPKTRVVLIKGVRATERVIGRQILSDHNNYDNWLKKHTFNDEDYIAQTKKTKDLKYTPLVSIITPTYNTNDKHLAECIESVINQTYGNWELILIDDASINQNVINIIERYKSSDSRIKSIYNNKNIHISGSTNKGIKISKGEYIGLLDHDDVLYPNALYEVVKSLQNEKYDFIYSDEDKLSEDGKLRFYPFFKPDWSPDFLRSVNYITHLTVIKKNLVDEVGGLRKKFDGAQDWDLFLRTTQKAKHIHHISKILYGWRMSDASTAKSSKAKPYISEAQKNALLDDAKSRGYKDIILNKSKLNNDYWDLSYRVTGNPLVSIIIPTKNQCKVLKRCINSIIEKSTYKNYEIILVDTGSNDCRVLNWYEELKKSKNIKIIDWPEQPFNHSRSCNVGAQKSSGDYLIMLNNDTEVISSDWIELLLGDSQRNGVGSVGARLYYPRNIQIQHAGIGVGLGGHAANLMTGGYDSNLSSIQKLYTNNKRNVACCTAACLMIPKKIFTEIGGFDEDFGGAYNDVDLGIRILEKGYVNIYNPAVVLTHHESISLGKPGHKNRDSSEFIKAKKLLVKKWPKYIDYDPYYNPNFSKNSADFALDVE